MILELQNGFGHLFLPPEFRYLLEMVWWHVVMTLFEGIPPLTPQLQRWQNHHTFFRFRHMIILMLIKTESLRSCSDATAFDCVASIFSRLKKNHYWDWCQACHKRGIILHNFQETEISAPQDSKHKFSCRQVSNFDVCVNFQARGNFSPLKTLQNVRREKLSFLDQEVWLNTSRAHFQVP